MKRCVRTLALNLKHLRKSKNYSQKYLSELADVSRITILNIEAGRSEAVTLNTLMKLSEALDVSVGDFFAASCPTCKTFSNMVCNRNRAVKKSGNKYADIEVEGRNTS